MSELRQKLLKGGLPPMGMPRSTAKVPPHRRRDYTPLSWTAYFDEKKTVDTERGQFCVYTKGSDGPVLLCLHGGGFSALTWAAFTRVLVAAAHCRVLAFDQRGHGDTVTEDDTDLSMEVLSIDVAAVVRSVYADVPETPPIIIMGHSMGGAVAVHSSLPSLIPSLIGLIVLDVVEGSAMEALAGMKSFLRGRPPQFKSLEHAIEWSVRSGQIKNLESARVSMIGQVKPITTKTGRVTSTAHTSDTLAEEDELTPVPSKELSRPATSSPSVAHTWRIDLEQTEQFWPGWFQGLSARFLEVPVPKVLILAGVDRLDKDLAIGQMQGKFQMQIVGQVGHAVHEDAPDKVADVVATFLIRNKFAEPGENFHRTFPAC